MNKITGSRFWNKHKFIYLFIIIAGLLLKDVVSVVDDHVIEELPGTSVESVKQEWGLVILPHRDNAANTLVRRTDETLNLTCMIEHYESLHGNSSSLYDQAADEIFKLSRLLPFMQQNSKNRVSFVESTNTLQLIITHLKDADTGEYQCEAKSLNDANFSVVFTESVRVKIKPSKGGSSSTCGESTFACTGTCISRRFVCDGKPDCKDASDESVTHCGTAPPCEGKLRCMDGRCISPHWCCDRSLDPNCSATVTLPCCRQLLSSSVQVNLDVTQYSPQPQQYNDMGFLQTTIYTVIGCAMAFMFIITIMVIAICRVHLKRTAIARYPHHLNRSTQRHDSWGNIFLPSSGGLPYASGTSGLLVTYNINNGVQFVGRPTNPPPYSEVIRLPPREGPPPPYASVENLASATSSSVSHSSQSQRHDDFVDTGRNRRNIYVVESEAERLGILDPLLATNNNGDINGNNTDEVQVEPSNNPLELAPNVALSLSTNNAIHSLS